MTIDENHWLVEALKAPIPGGSPMAVRRFLVMHFTSGASAQSSIDFWRTPAARGASAHIVIDRDGTVFQCRPFNRTCGHAGRSSWTWGGREFVGLNSCSIGIELANAGDSAREDGTAFSRFQCPAGVIMARHPHGGPVTAWERYPDVQLRAALDVAGALVIRYNLDDVVGHEDIAPARKNDPGPAFPMAQFRGSLGFHKPLGNGGVTR